MTSLNKIVTHDHASFDKIDTNHSESSVDDCSSTVKHLESVGIIPFQAFPAIEVDTASSDAVSNDDSISSDIECFHDNQQFVKKRRNAIDFSPVDPTTTDDINSDLEPEYESEEENNNKSISVLSNYHIAGKENMNENQESVTMPVHSENESTKDLSSLENSNFLENYGSEADDIFDTIGVKSNKEQEDKAKTVTANTLLLWSKDGVELNESPLDNPTPNMNCYALFIQTCQTLCTLPIVPTHSSQSFLTESLTKPNASPSLRSVTAKRLLPQFECCFAYMHGGKDIHDAPIICLPQYPDFRDISEEDFQDVILYLTSVTRASDADVGFVLVVDRRRDKWPSLRAVLIRLAGFFPGCLRMVLVLRPVGFFQGKISNIGFRWNRDEFSMKVPMTMLSSLDELFNYIHPDQLTPEFGGSFEYDHKTWIRNRMLLEDFTSHAIDVGKSLEGFGNDLAETEFPNNISATQALIKLQQGNTTYYKTKIEDLMKAAVTLKNTIQTPGGGSILPNTENNFEVDTLQSIMSLIEETDAAFDKFWLKHEEKLKQCLELRQFEQDYRLVISKLTTFQQWFDNQNPDLCSSLEWVESLISETTRMNDTFEKCKEECILLADRGGVLIEEQHYAIDCIAPKCSELINVSTSIAELFQRKNTFLSEAHTILTAIDQLNKWCGRAMSLLASQTIEKPLALEGAKQALLELEGFFEFEDGNKPISDDGIPTSLKTCVQTANLRLGEVLSIYEKRRTSLKKVITRHVERPVQLVEPSKKSKPATAPVVHHHKTTETHERPAARSLSSSPKRPSSATSNHSSNHSEPLIKQQHVMKELLATERIYVEELKAIVEGYGEAIDDVRYADIVPDELKGNRRVLLGNMEDIYAFHSKVFLRDLEECEETPTLVGKCFINRKDDFEIYSNYCQNSANSEHLRTRIGEQHQFFMECQQRLGHRLSLAAYLLKPVQRITKYQLLLQQLLKYSDHHGKELQNAVQTMLSILKSVNDSMHQTAISGHPNGLDALGKLLMQGPFSMQIDHKKTKVKNLARPRFSKTVQRHLFLYEKELLFCKQQSSEASNSDNNATTNGATQCLPTLGGGKGYYYQFKNSIKMNAAGITETLKGDPRKFEIWYQGREDVYTLLSSSVQVKQEWVREIKKVLSSQPKSETKPPEPHKADAKKSAKAKRSESLNKRTKSFPSKTETPKPDKPNGSKKKSNLMRSASMGKGKNKFLTKKPVDDAVEKKLLADVNGDDDDAKGEGLSSQRKSRSLPRLVDPPKCSSDTDDTSDSSRTASGCRFVVMKDRVEASDEGEVVLHVGDIVDIVETGKKEGWVRVHVQQTGKEGWAPTNHLASVSDASSFESVSSFIST